MPHYVASDLCLHCLPTSLLRVSLLCPFHGFMVVKQADTAFDFLCLKPLLHIMEIDSRDGNCYNVWFWVLTGLIFRMCAVHIVQQQQGG